MAVFLVREKARTETIRKQKDPVRRRRGLFWVKYAWL
jgi:hypothetical protein